jgi:tRNA (guanine37-N1)-methyltransferase
VRKMTRRELLRRLALEVYGDENKASKIWKRIDIVGDIAIIKKPFDMEAEELKPLAEKLLEKLPYIKSVWLASTPVEGVYRLREYVHLAGEERSWTIHREYGCSFMVDIRKVYVSPRLSYEHYRVAKLVEPNETVINMYAGAGQFSIMIACHSEARKVYSIDINPEAYLFMIKNVELNHVEDKVTCLLGDAAWIVSKHLYGIASRVLMPLPELALEHLPYAINALEGGRGWIHIYLHVFAGPGQDPREEAVKILENRLIELGVPSWKISLARVVRTVGPRRSQVVVDFYIMD